MNESKVALITGAGRGIGKALALMLAADGYRTIVVSRSEEELQAVIEEIHAENGPPSVALRCDVSNPLEVERVSSEAVEKFGRIDLLVNNAGMGGEGTLGVSVETFDELFAVNLRAPFLFMKYIIPYMLEQGSGYVVNIASRAGKVGYSNWGAYGAGKFGLVGLGESVYREFAEKGIKLTTICPGWTDTDMARDVNSDAGSEEMITVSDIAETVQWLLRLSPTACIREVLIEPRGDLS